MWSLWRCGNIKADVKVAQKSLLSVYGLGYIMNPLCPLGTYVEWSFVSKGYFFLANTDPDISLSFQFMIAPFGLHRARFRYWTTLTSTVFHIAKGTSNKSNK